MADNKILLDLQIVQKGDSLQLINKQLDSTVKKTETYAKSQDNLSKKVDSTNKKEKALYQTNLSSAKGFSKLNQTVGGSSGSGALVGSYAILAANVFAVTAAFNTLRQAAGVEKLAEGLTAFSNTTGQSLDIVSKRLQETTGFAVSFEQAMRTAALSTSAGFGVAEMEGLTRVAKGASLALGRDMGDALDRLTRGAIKLEPEILDELGIMVRLDDATEAYAASLGKGAAQLTRFERQQAFMNAIITEGESKFGAIADSLDPNAYDTLAAAFADLSKNLLGLLNGALIPVINTMISMPGVFLGSTAIFAGSITKRMLPALGDLSLAAKKSAQAAVESIDGFIKMGGAQAQAARQGVKEFEGMPKVFGKLVPSIQKGTNSTEELRSAQRSLNTSIGKLEAKQKKLQASNKSLNATDTARLKLLKANKKEIDILAASQVKANIVRKQAFAQANLAFANEEIQVMKTATRETFGFADSFKKVGEIFGGIRGAVKAYNAELATSGVLTKSNNIFTKLYNFSLKTLKVSFKAAALSAKAFGAALLQAIPVIGQIILVLSLAFEAVKFLAKQMGFFSDESKAAKEAQKDLETVLDGIGDKMKTIEDIQTRANEKTMVMTQTFKIMGGLAKTVADEAIRAQNALVAAGEFDADKTFNTRENRVFSGSNTITADTAKSRVGGMSPIVRSLDDLEGKSEQSAAFIREQLGGSLGEFLAESIKGGKTLGQITNELSPLLFIAEEKFNGVSQSTEGLVTSFKEGEKEAGKFVRTLTQTTKYDGIAQQFATLENDLASVRQQALEAGADPIDFISDAIEGLGKNVTLLMGEKIVESQKRLSKIGQTLIEQRKDLSETTDLKTQEQLQLSIAANEKLYAKAKTDTAKLIEKEVKNTKDTIDSVKEQAQTIKSITKFIQQRSKATLAVAKNEHTILAAKSAQDAIDTKNKQLLTDELKLIKGSLKAIEIKRAEKGDNVELTKEENETLARQAEINKEINTLSNKIAGNSVVDAEAKVAGLKASQQELALQKELNTLTTSNLKKQAEIQALRSTGSTALSGGDAMRVGAETARKAFEFANQEATLKFKIIEAEFELLSARVTIEQQINSARIKEINNVNDEESKALTSLNDALTKSVDTSRSNLETQGKILAQTLLGSAADAEIAFNKLFGGLGNVFLSSGGGVGLAGALNESVGVPFVEQLKKETQAKLDKLNNKVGPLQPDEEAERKRYAELVTTLETQLPDAIDKSAMAFSSLGTMIQSIFGEGGSVASSLAFLASTTLTSFDAMSDGMKAFKDTSATTDDEIKARNDSMGEGLQGLANVVGAIGSVASAAGQQRVSAIDEEIAAEKKRDGKSKESLAKIAALEKKKEVIEKKNFERNKKLQMAQIAINTAAGIMKTIGETGFFGIPLALIVGAMGAAQLAMVAGTSFQGGGGSVQQPNSNTSLTIGKRQNAVDVSQATTSGELSYLRGGRTTGDNLGGIGGFPGAAMGRKGYADGGVVVGERGPEVITPSNNVNVTPNFALGGQGANVNFTINAMDASGVEDVLMNQRGNIIRMIREAANDHGEGFLEDIDTQTYGSST